MRRKQSALRLFRKGYDTKEIARILEVPEAVASREVYEERCREKSLPLRMERVHYRRVRAA